MNFLDHFNGLPSRQGLPLAKELDDKTLQCTRTGQVMLDFADARSLMDVIRDYYLEHGNKSAETIKQFYFSDSYPRIGMWNLAEFQGEIVGHEEIRWEARGKSQFAGFTIDRYLLHHSRYLELPLVYIHKPNRTGCPVLLWLGENGKASAQDWPGLVKYLDAGYDIVSIDPRGLGETRMPYKAMSPDDPALAQLDFDHAYVNPISGVMADYVYNSLLTGRPYFLQMIEDVEITVRFVRSEIDPQADLTVTGTGNASTLASAVAETLPNVRLFDQPGVPIIKWSEIVQNKIELWPIQYLLPGGAYTH